MIDLSHRETDRPSRLRLLSPFQSLPHPLVFVRLRRIQCKRVCRAFHEVLVYNLMDVYYLRTRF